MIKIFFSYSHKDENLRNEFDKHLSILKRAGDISVWHDRCIQPGSNIDQEITRSLQEADIILLLISSDFLDSDYCYDKEMKYALEKHAKGEVIVIPVILRPCDWHSSPFGKLLAIPTDGKPVTKFLTLDDAFLDVTTSIKQTISRLAKASSYGASQMVGHSAPAAPRSSNLRISKKFSDAEKDRFLDDAFDYIANFFEASLAELKTRNPQVESRFKRIDSQCFTASIYVEGALKAECMIFYGAQHFSQSINFSFQVSQTRNAHSNSLSLSEDGYMLYFTSSGMSNFMRHGQSREEEKMTNEGAAEFYWQLFIERLQ